MDEKLRQYRKTHKKCLHCKYLICVSDDILGIDYYVCRVKDKIIRDFFPDNISRRRWCKMFELDEDKE